VVKQQRLDRRLHEVDQVVVAPDVRQFMGEDGFDLARREVIEHSERHEDHRAEASDNGGNVEAGGLQQSNGAPDAEALLQCLQGGTQARA
jgi:hypothetical protein